MKVEVRCHAVLCKSEVKAKAIYTQLRQKMSFALAEYTREKTRRQNSRLVIQRTRSVPAGVGGIALPVRTQHLRQGQLFKPSSSYSNNAPHLCAITEELNEPEGGYRTGPNRLSWQPGTLQEEEEEEEEKSDVACGVEGQTSGWSSATDEQRNRGDGDDIDDDDDSVFLFKPPISFDCRLSDVFNSFAENGTENPCRPNYISVLPPSVNPCPDPSTTSGSEAVADSEAAFRSRYPGYRPPLSESDLDTLRSAWERTDPEGMETSKFPEFDDQSIESGFSEQDAHDT